MTNVMTAPQVHTETEEPTLSDLMAQAREIALQLDPVQTVHVANGRIIAIAYTDSGICTSEFAESTEGAGSLLQFLENCQQSMVRQRQRLQMDFQRMAVIAEYYGYSLRFVGPSGVQIVKVGDGNEPILLPLSCDGLRQLGNMLNRDP